MSGKTSSMLKKGGILIGIILISSCFIACKKTDSDQVFDKLKEVVEDGKEIAGHVAEGIENVEDAIEDVLDEAIPDLTRLK